MELDLGLTLGLPLRTAACESSTDRSLNTGSIQTEPDPQHPFRDSYRRVFGVRVGSEPHHGQQETEEAPIFDISKGAGSRATPLPTYHAASAVSSVKSAIIDLSERNSMLFDMTLNANRGIRTGAPIARTSSDCCAGAREPVRQPCILSTRYTQ